jgi:hypothetical protein
LQNKFDKYVIRVIDFVTENGLTVNFLLAAAIVTYLIIGIDLETELSVQKEEIDSVVATLTNSINTLSLNSTDIVVTEPPVLAILYSYDVITPITDVTDFPKGRSPPL